MKLKEPYQPRTIHFLELWQEDDWTLKIYNIRFTGKAPNPSLVEASKEAARKLLPQPARTPDRYGVGFIGIHQGKSYDFVTVAWWAYDTELHQQTFMRPSSLTHALEPVTGSELSSDVWDLRLLAFERDAWVQEVLTRKPGPSLEGYLSRRLEETA